MNTVFVIGHVAVENKIFFTVFDAVNHCPPRDKIIHPGCLAYEFGCTISYILMKISIKNYIFKPQFSRYYLITTSIIG